MEEREALIEQMKEKLDEYRNQADELSKRQDVASVQELIDCCQKMNFLFQEIKRLQELKVPAYEI